MSSPAVDPVKQPQQPDDLFPTGYILNKTKERSLWPFVAGFVALACVTGVAAWWLVSRTS